MHFKWEQQEGTEHEDTFWPFPLVFATTSYAIQFIKRSCKKRDGKGNFDQYMEQEQKHLSPLVTDENIEHII